MQPSDLTAFIAPSCEDVLDAMYFTSVLDVAAIPPEHLRCAAFSYALHFAGDLCGRFGVRCNEQTARTLAANFLGGDEEELGQDEIAEVIGELANMLCGSILSRTGRVNTFSLSHPLPAVEPPAQEQDEEALHATLNTDNGPIHTWILFNRQTRNKSARGDE